MPRPKLAPADRRVHVSARIDPTDMALARHLFGGPHGGKSNALVLQMAVRWAVLDAGQYLTDEQRARITGR